VRDTHQQDPKKKGERTMNDFIKAIGHTHTDKAITAHFTDGSTAVYTMAIYNLLITDKAIECITDNKTGEIIHGA
jgi:hypothetical protein